MTDENQEEGADHAWGETERLWTAAATARDAPWRVRGLAYLGLGDIARHRKSFNAAQADGRAAEQAFRSGGDVQGTAAALIFRIWLSSARHSFTGVDSAAYTAESYCKTEGLADCLLEVKLSLVDAAEEMGDTKRLERLWTGAEDDSLRSGLLPVRVMHRQELTRLKQYIGANLSLSKSREYFRWAKGTGNLALIQNSALVMVVALIRDGQPNAAVWYQAMAHVAAVSLAKLPASTRLLNGALIDYGLLDAGVDPSARPELFAGFDFSSLGSDLLGATRRILKIEAGSDPVDSDDDKLETAGELQKTAKEAERYREQAFLAMRKKDIRRAPVHTAPRNSRGLA
jgi:hypothetical protein